MFLRFEDNGLLDWENFIQEITDSKYTIKCELTPGFKRKKWNIAAGIYYDRTLYRKFKKTPAQDKLYMTFASYNAGYSRILRASKKTENKEKNWEEIKPFLPKETRGYVTRIRKLMGEQPE